MPTEKELPAIPTKNAHTSSSVKVVARLTMYAGGIVARISSRKTRRPPKRSARMPKASRQREPFSTATAASQLN